MQTDNFDYEQSEIKKDFERKERLKTLETYEGEDKVVYGEDAKVLYQQKAGFEVKTSLPALDEATEGFRIGELVIVSGPTKNGKTSFCQTLSVNFAKTVHSLWFPFEGGHKEFFRKYPSDKMDFYIPQKPKDHSVRWVEDRIIEAKLKFDTKVVFIDNLDFLYDNEATISAGIRNSNFATYVGGIVKKIKEIAMEQEVIVFLMVHLAKAKWNKEDLPDSSDIRDSSRIPQLSDFVLMIMREKMGGVYTNKSFLKVAENRHNGKTIKIPLNFNNGIFTESSPFEEPEKEIEVDKLWN